MIDVIDELAGGSLAPRAIPTDRSYETSTARRVVQDPGSSGSRGGGGGASRLS